MICFLLLSSVNAIFINAKHRTRPISQCLYLSFVRTRVHDNGNYINTTGSTRGAGTDYSSGAPPVFNGVRVTRSLVLYVCFVDRCLFFCTFSFGHCVVCSSSIYGFWLPFWYLQTLTIVLSDVLRYTDSDYPFGIFKLWPLCCLLFFDIRLLITSLVFSNCS